MQSDDYNDGNDQKSYYESIGDDDEMIHTTASKKEVRNTILFKFISSSNLLSNNQARKSMREDSMFLMFEDESSDE
jgi:hypothetical protein